MDINNRVVLIIGPSSTGKTTLSKKIEEESPVKSVVISHDDVLEGINKNRSQDEINLDFRLTLIEKIFDAINDNSNELIILDTLNYDFQALNAVLMFLRMFINYEDGITLVKMNPPLDVHKRYILEKKKNNSLVSLPIVMSQRDMYISEKGSLFRAHPFANEEIIISNLKKIKLNFNLKNKEYSKK